MIRSSSTIACLGLLGTALALAQGPALLPEQGEVEGKAALAFFALAPSAGSEADRQLLDPTGMSAHLIRMEGTEALPEQVMPAGAWVVPPPGFYRFWIEGNGWISPSHGVMRYSAPPFNGRGSMVHRAVVPAGTVRLAPGESLGPDEELRLLHLNSHQALGFPQPEMSRRVTAEASQGVLMPAGPVLAGVFNTEHDEYRWLAQPVEVPARGVVDVAAPTVLDDTSVLVLLDRPQALREWTEDDIELLLSDENGDEHPPDVWISTAERVYGVFFHQTGRLASVRTRSPSAGLPEQQIALRPRKVETFRGSLRPLPKLAVALLAPHDFGLPADTSVQVVTYPERHLVAQTTLSRDLSASFEHVPARELEVVVEIPPSRLSRRVDLGDWRDRDIEIEAKAIRIHGVVYKGDEAAEATIAFQLYGSDPKFNESVVTDDEGRYEVTFYRPPSGATVELAMDGGSRAPHWEVLAHREFGEDSELDFHVPDNLFTVSVVSSESGEAIAGATVRYGNLHVDGGQEIGKYHGGVETDVDGLAPLPALRSGTLEVHASADGFLASEITEFPIGDLPDERTFELTLEPEDSEGVAMIFLRPEGIPASGAEVVALDEVGGGYRWSGQADPDGLVSMPDRFVGAPFAARAPGAGFLTGRVPSGEGRFVFPDANPPLLAQVVSQGEFSPWARIALEVEGTTFHGPVLHWLVGASSADASGMWRGAGIPAGPFSITAWKAGDDAVRDPIALTTSFGRVVSPPWPSRLEVEAVD